MSHIEKYLNLVVKSNKIKNQIFVFPEHPRTLYVKIAKNE